VFGKNDAKIAGLSLGPYYRTTNAFKPSSGALGRP